MSFLSDTDVNKRAKNLFIAFENGPPPERLTFRLQSTVGDIQFLANYLADIPTATPITGTWDPANTAATATLSAGNTVVEFDPETGIFGSTVGTVAATATALFSPCWEIVWVARSDGEGSIGQFPGDLSGYNANDFFQNGVFLAAINLGDVVGFVAVDGGDCSIYVNGTFQGFITPLASLVPCASQGFAA